MKLEQERVKELQVLRWIDHAMTIEIGHGAVYHDCSIDDGMMG